MADADGELLVVLLDMSLLQASSPGGLAADKLLQQLLVFLKAHQLLSEHNHQSVIAVQQTGCPMLYTPSSTQGSNTTLPALLLDRVAQLLEQQQQQVAAAGSTQQQQQQEVALSGALSRALCYANRLSSRYGASTRHKAKPRVLSIVAAADTPLQYIPLMNCIFAAQAAGIVLDAVVLGPADSAFLQQAAHITGGIYLRPQQPAGLLQYLLGAFSADSATREVLSSSAGTQAVDYRASCFCHKTIIDTGYICSVCLSIFCKANMKLTSCPMCGSAFKQKAAGGGGGGGKPAQQQQQQQQAAAAAAAIAAS